MLRDELTALLQPVVADLGYQLWELEYVTRQGGALLRLYIDQPEGHRAGVDDAGQTQGGITVDDCARVSHAVSETMDAADPLPGAYTLEVSSPGLDRVLRTQAHFERYVGERVRVETRLPVQGRKRFLGRLAQVVGGQIVLEVDGEDVPVSLDIAGLHKARLVPEL